MLDYHSYALRPIVWKFVPNDFCQHQGILEGQCEDRFTHASLYRPGSDLFFLVLADGVGRRFAPVLVNAIFELDDGAEAHFLAEGHIGVDILEQRIIAW